MLNLKKIVGVMLLLTFSTSVLCKDFSHNRDKRFKKNMSKIIKMVKNTENVEKKEKILAMVVNKIKKSTSKRVRKENLSKEEEIKLQMFSSSISTAFDSVKGGSSQDLNNFANYLESEVNQASVVLGIILGAFLIFFISLMVMELNCGTPGNEPCH